MAQKRFYRFLFSLTLLAFFVIAYSAPTPAQSGGANTPQNQNSDSSSDKGLKSLARVNPSTLAMELNVPLMNYPGRNGNSLPVSLSYSSKLWRMDGNGTYFYTIPSGYRQYVTNLFTKFAERSAAGWTSSVTFPVIEEKLETYDQAGRPFNVGVDDLTFNQQALGFLRDGEPQNNAPGPPTSCGWNCLYGQIDGSWVCLLPYYSSWGCQSPTGGNGPSDGCQYSNTGYCPPSCASCTGGGSIPEPPPNPPNPPNPQPSPQMFYVKRVHVKMGDGATTEFRKSDATIGYCTAGQYDGPNCEGNAGNVDNLGVFLAIDGSGMKLERTTEGSTLFLPNGSRFLFPAQMTGSFDDTSLYQSSDFIDVDGNRSKFLKTTENNQTVRTITDSLGRVIKDPLPENLWQQEQQVGSQDLNLPGMDDQVQNYKLKWLPLKPTGCEEDTTGTCGQGQGALEDQTKRLFYPTGLGCNGGSYYQELRQYTSTTNPNYANNENLFLQNGIGLRSCTMLDPIRNTQGDITGYTAKRFNPTVLAEIILPNGKKYEFKYNQYGEITRITYPTGSYETFKYKQIPPMNGFNEGAYDQTNRGVYEHKVFDINGTLQQRTEYSAVYTDNISNYLNSTYKITTQTSKGNNAAVNGGKSERYLYVDNRNERDFGFSDPRAGRAKEELGYDEAGTLRSRTLTEWIVKGPVPTNDPLRPAYSGAMRDARVKRTISVVIENNQALATLSESDYETPGENNSAAPIDADYFAHLNLKRAKSYHYAVIDLNTAQNGTISQIASYFNGSILASVSETDYQYVSGYKARGIASLPIESRVLNPQNTSQIVSKTQTAYDEYDFAYTGDLSGNLVSMWSDPASSLRGKPTTGKVWDSDNNTWIQKHSQYDKYGNIRKIWEPNESVSSDRFTETKYGSQYGFAYVTEVIAPAFSDGTHGTSEGSVISTTYDFKTGLPLTTTNDFGQVMATEYDTLLRPTRTFANSNFSAPETQTIYNETYLWVKVRKQIDENNWDESTTFTDSLGRVIKTQLKDSQGDVFVDTLYDASGRVKAETNPYRLSDTKRYFNRPRYDAVGRAVESCAPVEVLVINQTASFDVDTTQPCPTGTSLGVTEYGISTAQGYVATTVTTTDAAGKKGRSFTNVLGQLIRVDEPDYTGGLTALPQSTPNPSPTPNPPTYEPPPTCSIPGPNNCLTGTDYASNATVYRYNAQGKMVEVIQGEQHRYFKYDSLGRLIRVRQPEQEINPNINLDLADNYNTSGKWTAAFSYDALGNVKRATDANGVNIIYEYDKSKRITKQCFTKPNFQTSATQCSQISGNESPNTSAVEYFYDGIGFTSLPFPNTMKGKLTRAVNGVSETRYTMFDQLGRLTESEQRTPFGNETVAQAAPRISKYTYNLSGALIEQEYPSGRKVKSELESDGDLARVYGSSNASAPVKTYANSFSFTASGGISQMRFGNGRWETAKFNERMQVTELGLGNSATDASLWKLGYEYGELDSNGTTVTQSKNTGNIARMTISFAGMAQPFVQSFKYDSLYRLTEARETQNSQQTWIQQFVYDRYGNRTGFNQNITGVANGQITQTPQVDSQTNRFTSNNYSYDFNGNIIKDLSDANQERNFAFDGNNKQIGIKDANGNTIGRYYYDGQGKRVKKVTNLEETVFVYDGLGKLVAEYSTEISQTPQIKYLTADHLKTPRIITDATGQLVARRDFLPFGEDLFAGVGTRSGSQKYGATQDDVRQKFTGYQKDKETSLDFAEARMYENRFGRFTTVDPLLASGKSANPQTFNRYIYVGNNPIIITDPTGLTWYYNRVTNRNDWYDEQTGKFFWSGGGLTDDWSLVTDGVGAGHFVYGEGENWTTLDPDSSNYSRWWSQDSATWEYGSHTNYNGNGNIPLGNFILPMISGIKTGNVDRAMYGFWGTAATLASVPRSAAGAAKEVLSEGFSYITGLPFLNPKSLFSKKATSVIEEGISGGGGKTGGLRVAFGVGENLDEFSNATKSTNYFREFGASARFNEYKFYELAEKAEEINFNLRGVGMKEFYNWQKLGQPIERSQGFSYTRFELDHILSNPNLRNKTNFHFFPEQ